MLINVYMFIDYIGLLTTKYATERKMEGGDNGKKCPNVIFFFPSESFVFFKNMINVYCL